MPFESLFEKYGGFSSIYPIVSDFYEGVLDSDLIAHMFDDVDMENLIHHQTAFISQAMGGPGTYDDMKLVTAHENLNIQEKEWDEVVTILVQTLEDNSVERADIDALVGVIASKKPLIVSST